MGRLRRSSAAPHGAVHTPAPHGLRPTGHAVAWPRTAKGIQHRVLSKTSGTRSRNNRRSMARVLSHRRTDDLASPSLIIRYVECTGRFIIYPILVRLVATGEEIVRCFGGTGQTTEKELDREPGETLDTLAGIAGEIVESDVGSLRGHTDTPHWFSAIFRNLKIASFSSQTLMK